MAQIDEILDELLETVDTSEWEETDAGWQLLDHNWQIKLRRRKDSLFELVVQSYDGNSIADAQQHSGGVDPLTLKLALLAQRVEAKPQKSISGLDNVLHDLRARRR
jgi:hypothetical protein